MGALLEVLEQVRGDGSASVPYLREQYHKELEVMQTVNEVSNKETGWMGTKDLLAGSTVDEKVADFINRTKELGEVSQYLHNQDVARAEFEQLNKAMPERRYAGENGPLKVEVVNSQKTVGEILFEQKAFENWQSGLRKGVVPAADVLHQLKAATFTGSVNATGLLPTDTIGRVYPMLTSPLDYFNVRAEPGSVIRYYTPPDPTAPVPGDGTTSSSGTNTDRETTDGMALPAYGTVPGARVRTRGARLGERAATWNPVSLPKQSEGAWMPVHREDARDNPAVLSRTVDQLIVDVKMLVLQQIFQGNGGVTGANRQWNGLLGATGTDATNIDSVSLVDTHVPVVSTANVEKEPLAFIENLYALLRYRGIYPTALFVDAATWTTIRKSQRVARYQQPDYTRFPNGDVQGIPMVITSVLPANQMFVVDTQPENLEVVLGSDIQVDMSDDFAFANNQVAMRAVVDGNVPIYLPASLIRVSATNLFEELTF